jgi:hypothetical protein
MWHLNSGLIPDSKQYNTIKTVFVYLHPRRKWRGLADKSYLCWTEGSDTVTMHLVGRIKLALMAAGEKAAVTNLVFVIWMYLFRVFIQQWHTDTGTYCVRTAVWHAYLAFTTKRDRQIYVHDSSKLKIWFVKNASRRYGRAFMYKLTVAQLVKKSIVFPRTVDSLLPSLQPVLSQRTFLHNPRRNCNKI